MRVYGFLLALAVGTCASAQMLLPSCLLPARAPVNAVDIAYDQYRVRKGDTLFSISRDRYGTGKYQKLLQEVNDVNPKKLSAGTVLLLPKDPGKLEKQGNPSGQNQAQGKGGGAKKKGTTLGGIIDAFSAGIKNLREKVPVEIPDGPWFSLIVLLVLGAAAIVYFISDLAAICLGTLVMRLPETRFRSAAKVSGGSLALQVLTIFSLLLLGVVVHKLMPETFNLEAIRSWSWQSRIVRWSVIGFLGFLFLLLPLALTRTTYRTGALKSSVIVFLALALKVVMAVFPTAGFYVLTAAESQGMILM